ncbi:MAG: Ig-like domain-containing protein [Candidatus Methylumidiphilus sp.]
MKTVWLALALSLGADSALAFNVSVNITHPANGSTVSDNFHSSFTSTCPGGKNTVKWYLDGVPTGSATFRDTAGVHIARKLAQGAHSLKVVSSCGADAIQFNVQEVSG